jgi:tripartite-type tricarboxylate transporter receptor subunit TctC
VVRPTHELHVNKRSRRRAVQAFATTTPRRLCAIALGVALLSTGLAAAPAPAQDAYPSRTIRLIVPYPPGAVTDAMSRPVAAELSKVLGQSVIIENKPGGGTVVGTQAAKYAPADGYTLLYQSNSLITNLVALKQPGYALSDFTPVGTLGQGAFVLMTSTKHPFKSLQELVAYGKANPGKLNYSTTGPGSPASIVSFKLGQAAGMDWIEIPFKGGAEATQAVMSGDSHAFAASQGAPLIHANPDKMRMAAISADKRSEFLPNVPTFRELGYPQVTYESWSALFVRSDTPAPVIARLKSALAEVMKSPVTQAQMKQLSVPPYEGSVDELRVKIEKELAEFKADAKQLGIEPQ